MTDELTVGSLFSGIGGFDLGFERTGHMRTVWFCEQDPFCQRVLARHWPGVPIHDDVRALVADTDVRGRPDRPGAEHPEAGAAANRLAGRDRYGTERGGVPGDADAAAGAVQAGPGGGLPVPVPYVDVLCGGFPCQDISVAGAGAGIDGERSGLWGEYARLIRQLRPRYVVVENVSALLARGMDRVLGDLAACGYDAEWDCIPASAVGAPHRRDRVWLVAYPNGEGEPGVTGDAEPGRGIMVPGRAGRAGGSGNVADADREGSQGHGGELQLRADGSQVQARWGGGDATPAGAVADPDNVGRDGRTGQGRVDPGRVEPADGGWWSVEPDVGRVANGVPNRVDRLRALGNALVPQIAEIIGRRIVELEEGLDVTPPGFFPVPDREEWGTPTAHPRTHTPRKVHHGRQLANEVAEREAEGA